MLSEPPSTEAACSGAAGCTSTPRSGLRKRRPDMINDGVTHVRSAILTRRPGAECSAWLRHQATAVSEPVRLRTYIFWSRQGSCFYAQVKNSCTVNSLEEEKQRQFQELPSLSICREMVRVGNKPEKSGYLQLSWSVVCFCFLIFILFPGCLGIFLM